MIISKIVDDVKTGLKGVRGAGDALRGDIMAAADQAFGRVHNQAQTQASVLKNQAIADKGKRDMLALQTRLVALKAKAKAKQVGAGVGAVVQDNGGVGVAAQNGAVPGSDIVGNPVAENGAVNAAEGLDRPPNTIPLP
ncbi:hypothetical protein GGS21DRAFT_528739 [Xylaria nigripes]|nr:hypothetical protein GGS21DRAFT_528739 [Xylaria nigripes]